MNILLSTLWVTMALYFVYETSVVYSYLKKLPFCNWLTHIKEYESELKWNPSFSYTLYMELNHGGFFMDLVTCRYCFGFWMALGASIPCGIENLPIIYLLSQTGYSIFRASEKKLMSLGESSNE